MATPDVSDWLLGKAFPWPPQPPLQKVDTHRHWVPPIYAKVSRTNKLKQLCELQVKYEAKSAERQAMKNRLRMLERTDLPSTEEEERLMASLLKSPDKRTVKEATKLAEKREEERRKRAQDLERMEREHDREITKALARGDARKEADLLARRDRELEKLDRNSSRSNDCRQESRDRDDKEEKKAQKGKWLVIRNWEGK